MALSGPPSISVHTWRRRWYAAASRTSGLRGSIDGFDGGVDHVRIRRRHGETDAAQIFGGQAGFHLVPGGPRVGGFVDGALRPAVDQRPYVAAALVRMDADR